jgi:hypothetical protein
MAELDAALIAAYRAAEYVVLPPSGIEPIVLRIGQATPELARLANVLEADRTSSDGPITWAFLTACNPSSTLLPDDENHRRLDRLRAELVALGLSVCDGVGRDVQGLWTAEPGLVVLHLDPSRACAVGRRWEQHAIVAGVVGGTARLIRCRDGVDLTEVD